jgi:ribonuclease BN (tRNA processing enzyme)
MALPAACRDFHRNSSIVRRESAYTRGMTSVRVVFLGTGDAFAAGGSQQASCLVQCPDTCFLLDCGPGALASLKRAGISPGPIDTVLLSHLHGDHFAGLPFFLLEYTHIERRRRPLRIAGPSGTRKRVAALCEAMYPGFLQELPFEPIFIEMQPDERLRLASMAIETFRVPHQPEEISLGLCIEVAGRRLAYSGDTGWTEELVTRTGNADLFICECSFYETRTPFHLDYLRLAEHRARFGAKRVILTHLGEEVLARSSEVDMELAFDGLIVEI